MYTPGPATNFATASLGFRQNEHDAVACSVVTAIRAPQGRLPVLSGFTLQCQGSPYNVRVLLTRGFGWDDDSYSGDATSAVEPWSRRAMMCTSIPAGAASWEIFLTMEPPLFNSCQRLLALEPTTIWVI